MHQEVDVKRTHLRVLRVAVQSEGSLLHVDPHGATTVAHMACCSRGGGVIEGDVMPLLDLPQTLAQITMYIWSKSGL